MEDWKFQQLREILFQEDQKEYRNLAQKVEEIQQDINTRPRLQQKVEPIIDDKINFLKEHFPELFGPAVTETIKIQIKESQHEVIEALYPIMGKLIKKYVVHELEVLSEKIDQQLDKLFTWQGWIQRLQYWWSGASYGKHLMAEAMKPHIEEVFIIEQYSSMLIGCFSRGNIADCDMVAGMLTAIKSFVKEAFARQAEELELIDYETYKIMIKNFKSYYVAVTVSGVVTKQFLSQLEDDIYECMEKGLQKNIIQKAQNDQVSALLKDYFGDKP